MSTAAHIQRFAVRAGELSTTFTDNQDGTFTLTRSSPPAPNGQQSWKAYRPAPGEAPALSATVHSLAEAEKILHSWTGAAIVDPDRP